MNRKNKYEQIGQRMRDVRETKGLTQTQLAEQLHSPLTATAISLYENGEREVPVDTLAEIAKITGVSVEYLVMGRLFNAPTINVALRADKDLWRNKTARKQVLDFIEFMKRKAGEKI